VIEAYDYYYSRLLHVVVITCDERS